MIDEITAIKAVISLVPQWYIADYGLNKHTLTIKDKSVDFFSTRNLTPDLKNFLDYAQKMLPQVLKIAVWLPNITAVEYIQQSFIKYWLELQQPKIVWGDLLDYLSSLNERTYENQPVTLNLIISNTEKGFGSIDDPKIQKIFDPLGTSMHTYIKINYDLLFVEYDEICWETIKDTVEYKFHPEFLRPIYSILKKGDYSIHRTSKGDLVIMGTNGLIAAKRKGQWKLYDVYTLKNTIADLMKEYRVGCNLFDILFDLSFKRHGALLVYDPTHEVFKEIVNKESIIVIKGRADAAREMLAPFIRPIAMSAKEFSPRKKRLFLEIASMDGAVIFDNVRILAFGAMIKTHSDAMNEMGARSTAARSAFLWGGKPIKISADGEISILFHSYRRGQHCTAKLEFL